MLALLFATALALAYWNGANDNFKATATLYGSGVLPFERARRLATVAQIAGSLASVAIAGALIKAFSGKGLVPAEVVGNPAFLVAVASGAAATVLLATRMGMPISTTHALVGGLAGAGLVFAPEMLAWAALAGSYFVPLLLSPLLATAAAAALYPIAHRARRALGINSDTCLCLGRDPIPVDLSPDGALVFRHTRLPVAMNDVEACRQTYHGAWFGVSVQSLVDRLHVASGFALGFARGLNDTPKLLGLVAAANLAGWGGRGPLVAIAGAMALGGWLRSRRVAETLAYRITDLNHGQGVLANGIASSLVIGASALGMPVSTTHVATGALFGIGVWSDQTRWQTVGGILAAWIITLPSAAAIAASAAWLLRS